ncbi:hypothetical protein ACFQY0_16500 [Haloferula chungangensis]|uniref:DUF5666 domain-containing protein n=1 Tax=Haloferula chungangensis TaxID=1048331 RepID=A0ABW2LAV0_9BACT
MKALLFFSLLAFGAALATPPMTARFNNGDTITGNLTGIDEHTITWESEFFTVPQALKLDRLLDISLSSSDAVDLPEGDHIAILTLTNEDVVRGSLISLDKKHIKLRTSYAGELVFRRDMVAALTIEEKPEIFYAGPGTIDEWEIEKEGDWTLENGELVSHSSSSISRDIGEHDRFRVAFDVEWRGNARFRIFTCADSTNLNEISNGFELVCQSNYAYLRKRTQRNGRVEPVNIGNVGGMREFQEREKVRIEILQDLISGRIRLIIGGRVVADWRDDVPGIGQLGSALHFLSDSRNKLRVSRIRVSSWDGTIEGPWQEAGIDPFGNEETDELNPQDHPPLGILLRNGDNIKGETLAIEDGAVKLKTELGEFELPVSRLRKFALRTPEEAANPELTWKPILRNGDIRAHFIEGDAITFQLIGFQDGMMHGKSQTFGEADFDLSSFSRLEFNLYAADNDEDW